MKQVKQNILINALALFNQSGFVNVRLQHIADSAGMSVGNLAYHFKTKDEIILSLYSALNEKQEFILKEFRVLPLFEEIDLLFRNTFRIQQEYLFFYLDTIEIYRAFPQIAEQHKALLKLRLQQIEFMLAFNTSRGAFIRPQFDTKLQHFIQIFCVTMDNWLTYAYINGNEINEAAYCKDLWSILEALFSELSISEFKQLSMHRFDFI